MKNIRSSVILLGAALGLAGMGGTQSAHAASSTINIDFQAGPTGNGDAINYSGTAADSDTGTMWNIIAPPNDNSYAQYGGGTGGIVTGTIAVSDLLYSDGSASTISLTGTNTGGNLSAYASASATGPAQDAYGLMNDYLIAQNGSTQSVTLTGLDIGDAFTLYLYGAGDRNLRQTAFTVGGVTESTTGVPGGDHDLTEGEDYVVFNGVLTSSTLTIDYTTADPGSPNYSAEGEFNGLQLTETPEPSSRALFVAGGFALVFLHRRLRKRSA